MDQTEVSSEICAVGNTGGIDQCLCVPFPAYFNALESVSVQLQSCEIQEQGSHQSASYLSGSMDFCARKKPTAVAQEHYSYTPSNLWC